MSALPSKADIAQRACHVLPRSVMKSRRLIGTPEAQNETILSTKTGAGSGG
jgi:hypothetical protein